MDNLDEIVEIFSAETDKKKMRKLFAELFTEAELTDAAKRWFIMKQLASGKPQREIAKEMEVSLCKITRGSRVLKQDDSVFREILFSLFDETHI